MVAAAFPVAKLGFLLIKQIAKPIAKSIAAEAKKYRIFREYVCIPIAQAFHWYEIKMKMNMLNIGGKVTKVPKLNEAKAIEQGSEILSEFIILSIASAILIYEYSRGREKEEIKEAGLQQERDRIKNKIFELEFRVEKQSTQIRELARTVIHIEEDIHKRSLRRIFEKQPKLSAELLESAQETDNKIYLVQPLEELSQSLPSSPNPSPSSSIHTKEGGVKTEMEKETPKAKEVKEVKEMKKEKEEECKEPKKGYILSAVSDILERKSN
jgi:hypothetical protein